MDRRPVAPSGRPLAGAVQEDVEHLLRLRDSRCGSEPVVAVLDVDEADELLVLLDHVAVEHVKEAGGAGGAERVSAVVEAVQEGVRHLLRLELIVRAECRHDDEHRAQRPPRGARCCLHCPIAQCLCCSAITCVRAPAQCLVVALGVQQRSILL